MAPAKRKSKAAASEEIDELENGKTISWPRGKKRPAEEPATPTRRSKRTSVHTEGNLAETSVEVYTPSSTRSQRGAKSGVKVEEVQTTQANTNGVSPDKRQDKSSKSPKKTAKKSTVKAKKTTEEEDHKEKELADEGSQQENKKKKGRRRTKEEKEAEAMPLAARTQGLKMFVGAHVSSAKGLFNLDRAPEQIKGQCMYLKKRDFRALHSLNRRFYQACKMPYQIQYILGIFSGIRFSTHQLTSISGNAFALFLKSQRKWDNPALKPEHSSMFNAFCNEHKYSAASHVLPHGSYLVNLAQKEKEKAQQAYTSFLDDLKRCESLGIGLYNFHPGTTGSHPRDEAIGRIASALNRAHKSTRNVKTVLETMAGSGNVIGSTFEDLRDIIALIDDKSRVGVCLDTCHVFAAGYDLRTREAFKATIAKFADTIGLSYLSALHLNDSKAPFASHRDLHQNIGLGFLGLRSFWNVMNEPAFENLPLVLETPIDHDGKEEKGVWAREIKLLESLIGQDLDSPSFCEQEAELAKQGEAERAKYQEAFDRKNQKAQKKGIKDYFSKRERQKRSPEDSGSASE